MTTEPDTPDTTTDANSEPRPFSTFLIEHNKGRTEAELTAKLAELVAAVYESGKAGSLTLKLNLKPLKDSAAGVVEVVDDIKITAPTARARTSLFFVDPDSSSLVRNDPNQHSLFS